MLEVWLKVKDKSNSILELLDYGILGLRDYDITIAFFFRYKLC